MSEAGHSFEKRVGDEVRLDDLGYPRGTLVIMILFGVLFGLAWLAMYLFRFLARGAPHA